MEMTALLILKYLRLHAGALMLLAWYLTIALATLSRWQKFSRFEQFVFSFALIGGATWLIGQTTVGGFWGFRATGYITLTSAPYNASGSSVTTTTVGTTAAGTSVVVTSAVSWKIGQGIYIAGAGAAGVNYLGTVTAISGTTFTLSPATSTSKAAGTVVQHDETNALQMAINDLATLSGGGTIQLTDGFYRINGLLQDTGGANSRILMPLVQYDGSNIAATVPITIRGITQPGFNYSLFSPNSVGTQGAILQSDGTSGSMIGAYDNANTLKLTNVWVTLENLTIRTYDNPVSNGLDLSHVAWLTATNLVIDTGVSTTNTTQPSTGSSYAFKLPITGNTCVVRLQNVHVMSYYNGFQLGECTYMDNVDATTTIRGFEILAANHPLNLVRIGCYHVPVCIISGGGPAPIIVGVLGIEHNNNQTPAWTNTTSDISDGGNFLYGRVIYNVVKGAVGEDQTFLVGGAANLQYLNMFNLGQNCTSAAAPAVCGNAAKGSVVVAAAATTVVVNTTEVRANSPILVSYDSSLGTKLGVTCNTTIPVYSVSARTPGTSFTITVTVGPITNPACFSYSIAN